MSLASDPAGEIRDGSRFPSNDNLRPIVALETQLPLAGTGTAEVEYNFTYDACDRIETSGEKCRTG